MELFENCVRYIYFDVCFILNFECTIIIVQISIRVHRMRLYFSEISAIVL